MNNWSIVSREQIGKETALLLIDFFYSIAYPTEFSNNDPFRNFVHSSSAHLKCMRYIERILLLVGVRLLLLCLLFFIRHAIKKNFSHCVNITTIKLVDWDEEKNRESGGKKTTLQFMYRKQFGYSNTLRVCFSLPFLFLFAFSFSFGLIPFDLARFSFCAPHKNRIIRNSTIASNETVKNGWANNRNY